MKQTHSMKKRKSLSNDEKETQQQEPLCVRQKCEQQTDAAQQQARPMEVELCQGGENQRDAAPSVSALPFRIDTITHNHGQEYQQAVFCAIDEYTRQWPKELVQLVMKFLCVPRLHYPAINAYADQQYRILLRLPHGITTSDTRFVAESVSTALAQQAWLPTHFITHASIHPCFLIHHYSTHVWEILVHSDVQHTVHDASNTVTGMVESKTTPSCRSIAEALAHTCHILYVSEITVSSVSVAWMAARWVHCVSAHGNKHVQMWTRNKSTQDLSGFAYNLLDLPFDYRALFERETALLQKRRHDKQEHCFGNDGEDDLCSCAHCRFDSHACCREQFVLDPDAGFRFGTCCYAKLCDCDCRNCITAKREQQRLHLTADDIKHDCLVKTEIAQGGFAEQHCFR